MELKEIKYFIAIAETGNMSKAAEKLFISQPALSHFLSKLEASLNVKLFHKQSNNSLVLTDAGKILLQGSKEIAAIHQAVLKQLSEYQAGSGQSITIGLSSERSTQLLTGALPILYDHFPGIKVDIMHHTVTDLKQLVKNGEVDFAYSAYKQKEPGFEYIPFDTLKIDVLVPAAHRLAHIASPIPNENMNSISLHDLAGEPLILLKKNTVMRDIEDIYFKENRFRPNVQIELLSIASSIAIIRDTQKHIGLFPRGYSPYHDGSVLYLNLLPMLPYEVGVYYKKGTQLTKAMKYCITLMRDNLIQQNLQLENGARYDS